MAASSLNRRSPRVRASVGFAVLVGLIMATLYSAWVTLLYLLGGPETFSENGLTVWTTIAAYYLAGGIGGLIVGLALPLARNSLGAIAVGILVGFVVFFSMGIASKGLPWQWSSTDWKGVAVLGFLWGGVGGWITRRIWT